VTVKEARFWDEGLPQPVIIIETKKPHRSPELTRAWGKIRMNRLVGLKIQSIAAWGRWPFQRRERAFASLRYGVAAGEYFVSVAVTIAAAPTCRNHTD
jgi:hypothetical protein